MGHCTHLLHWLLHPLFSSAALDHVSGSGGSFSRCWCHHGTAQLIVVLTVMLLLLLLLQGDYRIASNEDLRGLCIFQAVWLFYFGIRLLFSVPSHLPFLLRLCLIIFSLWYIPPLTSPPPRPPHRVGSFFVGLLYHVQHPMDYYQAEARRETGEVRTPVAMVITTGGNILH